MGAGTPPGLGVGKDFPEAASDCARWMDPAREFSAFWRLAPPSGRGRGLEPGLGRLPPPRLVAGAGILPMLCLGWIVGCGWRGWMWGGSV